MNKTALIKEILKAVVEREYYGDFSTIYDFLYEIKDTTVLGDILSDLRSWGNGARGQNKM